MFHRYLDGLARFPDKNQGRIRVSNIHSQSGWCLASTIHRSALWKNISTQVAETGKMKCTSRVLPLKEFV